MGEGTPPLGREKERRRLDGRRNAAAGTAVEIGGGRGLHVGGGGVATRFSRTN
jgi:hypothetical protein